MKTIDKLWPGYVSVEEQALIGVEGTAFFLARNHMLRLISDATKDLAKAIENTLYTPDQLLILPSLQISEPFVQCGDIIYTDFGGCYVLSKSVAHRGGRDRREVPAFLGQFAIQTPKVVAELKWRKLTVLCTKEYDVYTAKGLLHYCKDFLELNPLAQATQNES